MKHLRKEIVSYFEEYSRDDELLISNLQMKIAQEGIQVCSLIFDVLTHLRIEPEQAATLWNAIVQHRADMIKDMGRDVNLRTATCDYLCSVCKTLENPIVVELNIFEKHYHASHFDLLTGLYSRKCLDSTLKREMARSSRHKNPLSIIFFDIDNFKKINDTYGHLAGDECLKKVASIISQAIRAEDTAIRYGGEELLIILPHTSRTQAFIIGERIRKNIKQYIFNFDGVELNITVSGGISTYPEDGFDIESLIKYADMAMYQAKSNGKDNISISSNEKRRFIRMDYNETIEVEIIGFDDLSSVSLAYSKNISRVGILFEMPYPIEIGTRLRLKIPINTECAANTMNVEEPLANKQLDNKHEVVTDKANIVENKEIDRFSISGVVVRNEVKPEGKCNYDIGMSFLEMEGIAVAGISDYIDELVNAPYPKSLNI